MTDYKECRVLNCHDKANGIGLCNKHHNAYRAISGLKLKNKNDNKEYCKVFGCFSKRLVKDGLCTIHNKQLERIIHKLSEVDNR